MIFFLEIGSKNVRERNLFTNQNAPRFLLEKEEEKMRIGQTYSYGNSNYQPVMK